MTITVAPYSPRLDRRGVRYWSVLVDGQLLVVTLYKKGLRPSPRPYSASPNPPTTMPYQTQFVPPEEFLTHEGVTVYRTYADGEAGSPWTYWFTTNPDDLESEDWFDVRDLPRWTLTGRPGGPDDACIRDILRQAIESGDVRPFAYSR